jgi:hypothetical protein
MLIARKLMVVAAAASMLVSPIAVSAAETGSRAATTQVVRVGSSAVESESDLRGAGLLAILAGVALIVGVAIAAGGGGSNPTSP